MIKIFEYCRNYFPFSRKVIVTVTLLECGDVYEIEISNNLYERDIYLTDVYLKINSMQIQLPLVNDINSTFITDSKSEARGLSRLQQKYKENTKAYYEQMEKYKKITRENIRGSIPPNGFIKLFITKNRLTQSVTMLNNNNSKSIHLCIRLTNQHSVICKEISI